MSWSKPSPGIIYCCNECKQTLITDNGAGTNIACFRCGSQDVKRMRPDTQEAFARLTIPPGVLVRDPNPTYYAKRKELGL